jgi:hypothetical protein
LSFFARFLFSARFTGGGVPSTALDTALTMLLALSFFSFFFFGTKLFNHGWLTIALQINHFQPTLAMIREQ